MSRACYNCSMDASDCFRKDCISADGVKRVVKVVNRMLPGPNIIVCQNDKLLINVENRMNTYEATSIHWHGLRQLGSPDMVHTT